MEISKQPRLIGGLQRETNLPGVDVDNQVLADYLAAFEDRQADQAKGTRPKTRPTFFTGLGTKFAVVASSFPRHPRGFYEPGRNRDPDARRLFEQNTTDRRQRRFVPGPLVVRVVLVHLS